MELSICEDSRTTLYKELVLNRSLSTYTVCSPGFNTEGTGKNTRMPVFPGRGCTAYFSSCCPRVRHLIILLLEVAWAPPVAWKGLWTLPSPFLPSLTPMIKAGIQLLPGRSLPTHLALQLLWLPLERLALKTPTSNHQKGLAFASSPSPQNTNRCF